MDPSSSYPIRYSFSQTFDVPAKQAFRWCVDYKADDWKRMGKNGMRKIRRLNEDTLILTDTVVTDGQSVTKRRLVRLNSNRLAWTNTHVDGPNKHSQFWYQIVPLGRNRSRLDFTGLQVNYAKRRPSASKVAALARKIRKEDSGVWVLLAKEMSKDHHQP